jgi:hypothetical protein
MFQALRIRDFRLMWAGGLVSALGSWLLTLAIPAHWRLRRGAGYLSMSTNTPQPTYSRRYLAYRTGASSSSARI